MHVPLESLFRRWLWRAIFAAWLAWMAFDGWRLDSSLPTEVLVSGPTAHRFVIPGRDSCPESYDSEAEGCTSSAGKPTHVLRLRPGDYLLLNRDVDDLTSVSEVVVIEVRSGAQSWCMSRGPDSA